MVKEDKNLVCLFNDIYLVTVLTDLACLTPMHTYIHKTFTSVYPSPSAPIAHDTWLIAT